jgi:hypothetical protein
LIFPAKKLKIPHKSFDKGKLIEKWGRKAIGASLLEYASQLPYESNPSIYELNKEDMKYA